MTMERLLPLDTGGVTSVWDGPFIVRGLGKSPEEPFRMGVSFSVGVSCLLVSRSSNSIFVAEL